MKLFPRLLLLFFFWVPNVFATPVKTDQVTAELISEVKSIPPSGSFWAGIDLKIEDGWDIYWQNPGDSGIPTTVKWHVSDGLQAGEIKWPYPEKIETASIVTFGYKNEVILLSQISASQVSKLNSSLAATVDWLACKEICVPGHAELTLVLPVSKDKAEIDSVLSVKIEEARAHLPMEMTGWRQNIRRSGEHIFLILKPNSHFLAPIPPFQFFPDQPGIIEHSAPQNAKKIKKTAQIELKLSSHAPKNIEELKGVLVLDTGLISEAKKAFKVKAVPLPAFGKESASQIGGVANIWTALLFSLLGGLILNLMPCVLPILSIKVIGFVKQAAEDKTKVWKHALSFTAGVLAAFWAFALALIFLRLGGEQLGWGFQLQSPSFVVFLCFLFFLMSLNLFGIYEVGTSLTGLSVDATHRASLFGSFVSGALATVVATPCTAPFMGSALGFALTQPVWVSFTIFTALGIGMSLPYILFSLSPSLLHLIPKPGPWMQTLKQVMALLLFATVFWLAWVLYAQTGKEGVLKLIYGLSLSLAGAFILGKWGAPFQKTAFRMSARIVATFLILLGVWISENHLHLRAASAMIPTKTGGIQWEVFSPARAQELRAKKIPVFIDFTAAWCLSCQANERLTLNSRSVQEKFIKLGVVAMKADWTMRDERVTEALHSFGRNGVPLYVLYGKNPEAPAIILPEIITPRIVLNKLEELES